VRGLRNGLVARRWRMASGLIYLLTAYDLTHPNN
jgi:hypothetical protein